MHVQVQQQAAAAAAAAAAQSNIIMDSLALLSWILFHKESSRR
jgi:hypothetical protein